LVLLWVGTVAPSRIDDPTITTSPVTVGAAWMPISPRSRSICSLLPFWTPTFEIEQPVVGERRDHRPGLGVEARRDESPSSRR